MKKYRKLSICISVLNAIGIVCIVAQLSRQKSEIFIMN